jgi:K+:H+ antiporter subunit KhtT
MPDGSTHGVPDVIEQELPGIGRRYDLGDLYGTRVSVVIHHTGRRDLYVLGQEEDPRAVLSLTDGQARRLGAILGGAYFRPAVVAEMEAAIGELLIDWVTVEPYSPAVGRSIAELEIRRRTGMTIAAILRDHDPLVSPEPLEVLRAGDRLVVIGRREDLTGFLREVIGSPDG